MKRIDRNLSDVTKTKISNTLKQYNQSNPRGTKEDGSKWSAKISTGLKKYWSTIPKNKEKATIDDIIL